MDWYVLTLIISFIVILAAIIWNSTIGKDKKQIIKPSNEIYDHFIQKYQFKTENNICSGYFNGRKIDLMQNPLQAIIALQNTKNINLLFEQGYSTVMDNLIETPIQGAEQFHIKSNYPMLAAQIISDEIVNELKSIELFSFNLQQEDLRVKFGEVKQVKDVERLLKIAVELTKAIETVNYTYS